MKKNNYFICCEKCFEFIGKKNTKSAKLWMDLCANYLNNGELIVLAGNDFAELRALELLGFITSTDKPTNISVRIKGHILTEDGQHFFCLKEGDHG